MKEIFIGSSSEALDQAQKVADLLSEVEGVKPVLWTDMFALGDITFLKIEEISRRVSGAVFLATPDDESVVRERNVKVPRANVLFEYGYLTSMLTRARVALCWYTYTELPSDFAGLTYVPMGVFKPDNPLSDLARVKLKSWVSELPAIQSGIAPTFLLHGYSGQWHRETIFQIWRRIEIKPPDYVILRGQMLLQILPNGEGGTGCVYGNLQVQIGNCYAEFQVNDRIIDAHVLRDGSLRLRSTMQSRQRITLEGKPPQKDGFEPLLKGVREFEHIIYCPPDEPGILRSNYTSDLGREIYSKATEKFYR